MHKMKNIITLRLSNEDISTIDQLSKKNKKNRSLLLRDLLLKGKIYLAIEKYVNGDISISKAAEIAQISISEMMDLLSKLGIGSKLTLNDYFDGKETAEKLF